MKSLLSQPHLAARLLAEPRLALMFALGFSAGLPYLLVFATLSAWLREAGVSRTEIGLLSYVALAYSLKFLWAPMIDSWPVPGLGLLGRRRAWMLVSQLGVALGLVGLAITDPSHSLALIVVFAFFVAFASATQDVGVDGWRIDAAPTERQGIMSAAYQFGYRIAMLCAGAGALYIADFASWESAYLAMALLMAVGIGGSLLSPRLPECRPSTPAASSRARLYVEPVADLLRRRGKLLIPILLLVAIYRLPDFVSGVMANPLYIDLGFSKSDIATVTKVYGVWIALAGVFIGGIAVLRLGLMPALLIGGIAASTSHLTLAWLAVSGARLDIFTAAIAVESFASGFAGTALISYMSSLTSPAFAASQYALLSSLYALPGKLVGGLSGLMVDSFGYPAFFASTSVIGVPIVLLALIVWRRTPAREETPSEETALDYRGAVSSG